MSSGAAAKMFAAGLGGQCVRPATAHQGLLGQIHQAVGRGGIRISISFHRHHHTHTYTYTHINGPASNLIGRQYANYANCARFSANLNGQYNTIESNATTTWPAAACLFVCLSLGDDKLDFSLPFDLI